MLAPFSPCCGHSVMGMNQSSSDGRAALPLAEHRHDCPRIFPPRSESPAGDPSGLGGLGGLGGSGALRARSLPRGAQQAGRGPPLGSLAFWPLSASATAPRAPVVAGQGLRARGQDAAAPPRRHVDEGLGTAPSPRIGARGVRPVPVPVSSAQGVYRACIAQRRHASVTSSLSRAGSLADVLQTKPLLCANCTSGSRSTREKSSAG